MRRLAAILGLLALTASLRAAETTPALRSFETAHYRMHTDASDEVAREAFVRMDRMFEEYALRTAAFAGKLPRDKFPFYLYSNRADYVAAGGPPRSAGQFSYRNGSGKLMAIAANRPGGSRGTWHTIQHEGFHQFAFMVIAPNLPIWVNEGLAEYFGEAQFTGDAYVSGLIPESSRRKIVGMIENGSYTPFARFVAISPEEWGANLQYDHYAQAWSMVHFLASAENGKYQQAFVGYMMALSRGGKPEQAWKQFLGNDAAAFEAAWKKYWQSLPENPSKRLALQARVMTYTVFLARARAAGQKYATFEEFLAAAKADAVKTPTDATRWLPPALLKSALAGDDKDESPEWSLTWNADRPRLAAKLADGTTLVGTIATTNAGPRSACEIKPPPATRKAP